MNTSALVSLCSLHKYRIEHLLCQSLPVQLLACGMLTSSYEFKPRKMVCMKLFRDRVEAGEALAAKLESLNLGRNICVLALPRGGIPLGAVVASTLQCQLDMLFIKKIGAPHHEELAIGAVSESGTIWQKETLDFLNIPRDVQQQLAREKQKELKAQLLKWRKGRKPIDVKGMTAIVVDDGLATGTTMRAALDFLKTQTPKRIVVAVPVASHVAAEDVSKECDDFVTLEIPEPFFSVGQWYQDFTQVTDDEVERALTQTGKAGLFDHSVIIPHNNLLFEGRLIIPENAKGLVIFAHGSGSTHTSPRNQKVSSALNRIGLATLLFDLLTPDESTDRRNVFDIPLLVERLRNATSWALKQEQLKDLPVAFFGASTGAAAALGAASGNDKIKSVVSRGGRPDLAGEYLKDVSAKVLLIVGGEDREVIALNQHAKLGLYKCELVIVPGAGHLFEEGNTLDEVVEYASNWFLQTLTRADVTTPKPHLEVVEEIENALHPLSGEGISELARSLAESRVVMLGEASHGTEEFYKIRRLISEKLIRDHGFKFIAVEGDWPDCAKLNRYIQSGEGKNARSVMSQFNRWPTWMWANSQTEEMIEFMRGCSNSGLHVGFHGLDVYSLYESIAVIRDLTQKLSPQLRHQILEAYSCFESFDKNEIAYSRSLLKYPGGCANDALTALKRILRLRLEETEFKDDELFDAKQNARVIRNAERYYSSVLYGDEQSWNIRDEHMMDTLLALLQKYDDGAKGIVWAHNTHIGDYHATDMRQAGYINLGGLAREKLGSENVMLVGFGTYGGQVLAGRAWDATPEVMSVPHAKAGSYEHYLHSVAEETGFREFYLPMKETPSLKTTKGHRAIGVVYQPIFEQHGKNYVPTELAKRYDTFVFIDRTNALHAFPRSRKLGVLPETWPTGI